MYVRRDYSRSFFNKSDRPRRNYGRWLFVLGMIIGALAIFITSNLESLEAQALEWMGLAPTATPLPSDLATLADQLMVQGSLQQAKDLFERAIEQRPENVAYRYEYGRLMLDMDQPDISYEQGDAIINLNPNDPRGYALKALAEVWMSNPASAIPVALAGLDLQAGYESHLYSALARAYTNTGRYEEGAEAGAQAVQADPTDADARRSYAYTLSWVSATDQAIEQLEAAIMLDPSNIAAYMELAVQYLFQNRDQDAINIYDRVLALQPRNALALRRLCGTYRKVGQFERALGFCQDAVDADPQSVGAWYDLGILQYNDFQMQAASTSFTRCVELDPANYVCKHRLGLSYYYLDQCDAAWTTLQDSLLMAQAAQGQGQDVSGIIENIQAGLRGVVTDCTQYRNVTATAPSDLTTGTPLATVDPLITPTLTPEITLTPTATSNAEITPTLSPTFPNRPVRNPGSTEELK